MLLHDPDGDLVANPIQLLSNQPGSSNGFDWYAAEAANQNIVVAVGIDVH